MRSLVTALITGLLALGAADPGDERHGGGDDVTAEAIHKDRTVGTFLKGSKIVITGDGVGKGKGDGYQVKSPCWYEPDLNGEEMYRFQTDSRTNASRVLADEESKKEFNKQFEAKRKQPGRWWTPAYNQADPRGAACWADLQQFIFVPPNTTPPSGITIEQLAEIARASLTVPEPTVKLNPDAKSFVNLPTYVWLEGLGEQRRSVTATLPGIMSVTVVATLDSITIDPGTTKDRAEVHEEGCGAAGKAYVKGAAFGCGVRYLRASIDQPREKYTLTVNTVWPVTTQGDVVPFQFAPVQVGTSRDVPVGEIQSNVKP